MDATANAQRQFPCKQCGAALVFAPGQDCLKCPYCQAENAIETNGGQVREEDFLAALAEQEAGQETFETLTVKCDACGAESSLEANTTAGKCPFCSSPIVAAAKSTRQIKPKALLPFKIAMNEALASFRAWLYSLWFAPSDMRKYAEAGGLRGAYVPYWTYDCWTLSDYTGERGDDYTVTETYTEYENGKAVTKTRTVTKTRWWPVSGRVNNSFDDVLIVASETLPRRYIECLEPWDLKNLVPYSDDYLAGFVAESYQTDLQDGFGQAKQVMDPTIRSTIRSDIGGDHQRIHSVHTAYHDIAFKHILLPLWISAYRYRDKVYRFLVNARTGEVSGERPYSPWKIALAVLAVLVVIATVVLLFNLR